MSDSDMIGAAENVVKRQVAGRSGPSPGSACQASSDHQKGGGTFVSHSRPAVSASCV